MGQKKCVWWEAKEQRQIKSGGDLLDPMSPCTHKCAHTRTQTPSYPKAGMQHPGDTGLGSLLVSFWPLSPSKTPTLFLLARLGPGAATCAPRHRGGSACCGPDWGALVQGGQGSGCTCSPPAPPASTTSMNARFRQSVNSKRGENALGVEKRATKAAHIFISQRPGHNNNRFPSPEEQNKTKGFF